MDKLQPNGASASRAIPTDNRQKAVWFLFGLLLIAVLLSACSATQDTAVLTAPANVINPAERLNINESSGDDFQAAIPEFGARMVREFNEYKPYSSILEFRREIGKYVSDEQVAAYELYIFVPIDFEASDAATLMQVPGVDAAAAEALIAQRPFGTADVFLAALSTEAPGADMATAARYLR